MSELLCFALLGLLSLCYLLAWQHGLLLDPNDASRGEESRWMRGNSCQRLPFFSSLDLFLRKTIKTLI